MAGQKRKGGTLIKTSTKKHKEDRLDWDNDKEAVDEEKHGWVTEHDQVSALLVHNRTNSSSSYFHHSGTNYLFTLFIEWK